MSSSCYTFPDRRLPFFAVLGDSLACVVAFPLAALVVASGIVDGESTRAVLSALPIALLLLNVLVVVVDPREPPAWSVPTAVMAGVWHATLLFIGLLWVLVLAGRGGAVPVGLFVVAWGCLVALSALVRLARVVTARRIPG